MRFGEGRKRILALEVLRKHKSDEFFADKPRTTETQTRVKPLVGMRFAQRRLEEHNEQFWQVLGFIAFQSISGQIDSPAGVLQQVGG